MKIQTIKTSFKTDLHTPISLFLRIRNRFRKPMLLESNDYHSRTDSSSIIGFDPLVEIIVDYNTITIVKGNTTTKIQLKETDKVELILAKMMADYKPENDENSVGFFSYFGFEFAHLSERQVISNVQDQRIPLAHLIFYKYIVTIDHFHDTGEFTVNSENADVVNLTLEEILHLQPNAVLPFHLTGEETSNLTDTDYLQFVDTAKKHILRGDVFQLVLSREFNQPYFGDDFQVYRELRTLNPSPYLFYADYESHRIIGSSPEKQLQIKNGIAEIHPIAGTVRKTGDSVIDQCSVENLIRDEKENAEHTMLVDLARNDLSKYCSDVKVTRYKEIQHFSHVIHLVSKVIGSTDVSSSIQLFSGTFPAGTLSGTPKPKALELIEKYEPGKRNYYGGALGFIGFNGNINLAIIIRSMLSQNNKLSYRAGAGIVLDSVPENELIEVTNKLGAVRKAIESANSVIQQKEISIL